MSEAPWLLHARVRRVSTARCPEEGCDHPHHDAWSAQFTWRNGQTWQWADLVTFPNGKEALAFAVTATDIHNRKHRQAAA